MTEPLTGPVRIPYIPALSGMRALSLSGTIFAHYGLFLAYLPTAPSWLPSMNAFSLNVELFFVLSGALITSLLVSEFQRFGTTSMPRFYLRRWRRLGPALLAVLPLLVIIQFAVHGRLGGQPLGPTPLSSGAAIALFVSNWWFVSGRSLGWLGPTWTLGIEEQFYLTWPTLLRLTLRRRWSPRATFLAIGAVMVASVGASTIASRHLTFSQTFYLTSTQLPPILIGCALGYAVTTFPEGRFVQLLRSRVVALAGIAVIVLMTVFTWHHTRFLISGGYLLYGAAACLPIGHCFAVAHRPSVVSRVLGWRPLELIGLASYEAYLIHCVVIFAVLRAAPTMPVSHMIVLDTALIALLSGVFYYFVSRPVRRRGWRGARVYWAGLFRVPRVAPQAAMSTEQTGVTS